MAIISFDSKVLVDFIPKYGGNRDSKDPCVFSVKFIPYSRVQHFSRLIAARTEGITSAAEITEITQGVQREQFEESVEKVSNYFVGDKEVSAPAEVYDTADTELIVEVIKAMESSQKLREGQRKN